MMHACTYAHMRLEGGWVVNVPPAGLTCYQSLSSDVQTVSTYPWSLNDIVAAHAASSAAVAAATAGGNEVVKIKPGA